VATELRRVLGAVAPRAKARGRVRDIAHRLPSPVLLGALVVAIAGVNVWWRTLETRPPHWDMARHLADSLIYMRWFSVTHPRTFLEGYLYYPPFTYWITDAFYAVLGSEAMWVAILSNVVWLAVLVFATYGIGRRLWNARVGWLSVIFVVTAPMFVSTFKDYMVDAPLAAIAALSLYLLIRADGFANRRSSLAFGLACGCGLLVKWTFPLVLALPVVHASAIALAEARLRHRFDRLVNVGGAAAVTFAVAGTWYVHNFRQVINSLVYYSGPEGVTRGNPPVASPASALWYLWNLINTQLYLLPFLFVVVGVAFCFRDHELARRNVYPILMAAGTYLTFTLLRHKDPRYTLPMVPALAIVATSWLEHVAARVRFWAAAALVAYGGFAFVAISFGTSLIPRTVAIHAPSTSFGPRELTVFSQYGYIDGPPTHENWHQADIFKVIARFPRSQRTFTYEGPDPIWFNYYGLDYYSLRYDAKWLRDGRASFLIELGSPRVVHRGYARLERWRLPDARMLALYKRL
jgi:4-amino-4-deoxy-L-arabinose transferase-like glycosyltransferase